MDEGSNSWGYGAIIVPTKFFWQGLLLPDPKTLAQYVGSVIASAETAFRAMGKEPVDSIIFGAVQASLVAAITLGDQPKAMVFAATVCELSGKRFWIIDAKQDDTGTYTQFSELEVTTAEAARAEVESRVMPLKFGLMLKMMKEKK